MTDQTIDLSGWKMDDEADQFAGAATLEGVSNLAPGQSAIFVELKDGTKVEKFTNFWFGSSVPPGFLIGTYDGPGLGAGGDAVNVFNSNGDHITGVKFGASTTNVSFDNAVGLGTYSTTLPEVTTLSAVGANGAFEAHDQIGSPGAIANPTVPPAPDVRVTEVHPTSSSGPVAGDWFELTNMGDTAVDLTGWKADDDSNSFAAGGALLGVTTLPAGASAVFLENSSQAAAFTAAWFPDGLPSGFLLGAYGNAGIGLGSGGDQVNVFNAAQEKVTGVSFGASTTGVSFDNAAGLGDASSTPPPLVTTKSVAGVDGAFTNGHGEVASPGTIVNAPVPPSVAITEVAPWGSGSAAYGADWFELTNTGSTAVDLSGWKMDDSSHSIAAAVALEGVATLAPGESAIFLELEHAVAKAAAFEAAWFPAGVPAGFQIGHYEGSGVGLSTSGDAVNVFDATGTSVTGVSFGASTTGVSFDNAAGLGDPATPPLISTLSKAGHNGAFVNSHAEIGSPWATSGDVGLLAAVAPTFPAQAANTIGQGQWVTVTNEGFAPVTISRVRIEEADDASAGDFLVGADRCTGEAIAVGGTCRIQVRFAPGRENAASSASLSIASDAVNSPLRVSLAATSGGLPEGPKGDKGDTGDPGTPGDKGDKGDQGDPGQQGDKGDTGPKGDTGATGPQGPAGPAGPQGPAGKNGRNGKDGVVEFLATGSNAQARVGQSAHLKFRVKNRTAGDLRGARLSASSLGVKGTSSVAVGTIKAGRNEAVTLDLAVGRNASLGRHRVKVELKVGGHTITQAVVVKVTR